MEYFDFTLDIVSIIFNIITIICLISYMHTMGMHTMR